jgi:hypothetical protein
LRLSRAALGTALLAPPGLSERTLSLLRQAFTQAMRDPALPGAELQRATRLSRSPPTCSRAPESSARSNRRQDEQKTEA